MVEVSAFPKGLSVKKYLSWPFEPVRRHATATRPAVSILRTYSMKPAFFPVMPVNSFTCADDPSLVSRCTPFALQNKSMELVFNYGVLRQVSGLAAASRTPVCFPPGFRLIVQRPSFIGSLLPGTRLTHANHRRPPPKAHPAAQLSHLQIICPNIIPFAQNIPSTQDDNTPVAPLYDHRVSLHIHPQSLVL